ncbi:hypothetical protein AVEN_109659-1 [Araneus ventricosus]|uniref:Uncharacterized protein n=1 Tax=Araneus ventricosus TaxID=182803 RepID=A0A4Y2FZY9_ARAVE|nr:hypothetical protein AVEN_109659-1 [Araneus ventricosus]
MYQFTVSGHGHYATPNPPRTLLGTDLRKGLHYGWSKVGGGSQDIGRVHLCIYLNGLSRCPKTKRRLEVDTHFRLLLAEAVHGSHVKKLFQR